MQARERQQQIDQNGLVLYHNTAMIILAYKNFKAHVIECSLRK